MWYRVSNTSMDSFPVESLFCLIHFSGGKTIELPRKYPLEGVWGEPVSFVYGEENELGTPEKIDIVYISILEKIAYSIEADLSERMIGILNKPIADNDSFIVVGLGPFGMVAVWLYSKRQCVLIEKFKAVPVEIPNVFLRADTFQTVISICQQYIKAYNFNVSISKIVDSSFVSKMMSQFQYRYFISFDPSLCKRKDGGPVDDQYIIIRIRDKRFDGTFDLDENSKLFTYHFSGIPRLINVDWQFNCNSYSAYFSCEYKFVEFISRFYGAHPETKADFIIKIDAENRKYELALYRQGLKEPMVIPESAYQLIVFKNKFEDYRSENYNQPRGAWIW